MNLFAHCPHFLEVDLISSRLQPDRLSRADCSTQINRRALKMRAPEPIKRKMALFSGFPWRWAAGRCSLRLRDWAFDRSKGVHQTLEIRVIRVSVGRNTNEGAEAGFQRSALHGYGRDKDALRQQLGAHVAPAHPFVSEGHDPGGLI